MQTGAGSRCNSLKHTNISKELICHVNSVNSAPIQRAMCLTALSTTTPLVAFKRLVESRPRHIEAVLVGQVCLTPYLDLSTICIFLLPWIRKYSLACCKSEPVLYIFVSFRLIFLSYVRRSLQLLKVLCKYVCLPLPPYWMFSSRI